MKALIWGICILSLALILVLFQYSGVILGGIPSALLFGLAIWSANKMSKKWDEHKEFKKALKCIREEKQNLPNKNNHKESVFVKSNEVIKKAINPINAELCVNKEPVLHKNQPQPTIVFCRKCGETLRENSRFCHKCGTEVNVMEK